MKKLIFLVIVFCSISSFAQKTTSPKNNLSYMKNYVNKYPFEVKLIEKKGAFRTRLYNLMGKEKFQLMEDYFNVQNPIIQKNNVLIANGCMQHNCDGLFFYIFYDLKKDIINIGIKEGEKELEVLAEKKVLLDEAKAWKNDPYIY